MGARWCGRSHHDTMTIGTWTTEGDALKLRWHLGLGGPMHQHEHAAHGIDLEEGSAAWSAWVTDYSGDVENSEWVDAADTIRGREAFCHRNRARVVRGLIAKY